MFRNVLVPLDGSKLAESVLPWTEWVSERFGSQVTLLHVVENQPPKSVHGDEHLTSAEAAEVYIARVAASLHLASPPSTHVHTAAEGDVAASIVQHTIELATDLTIICTHGGTGARNVLVGSIAQQVLRRVRSPVLLLRPEMPLTGTPRMEGILVLLDGTPKAEKVLPLARNFAIATGVALRILMVVPTASTLRGDRVAAARMMPFATSAVLDVEHEIALDYIQSVVGRLREGGVSVQAEVVRGDVQKHVIEASHQSDVSMVAMASHGRSGLGALWTSSLGNAMMLRLDKPMLLLNPDQVELPYSDV